MRFLSHGKRVSVHQDMRMELISLMQLILTASECKPEEGIVLAFDRFVLFSICGVGLFCRVNLFVASLSFSVFGSSSYLI